MCGRYVREATPGQIAEVFDAALAFDANAVSLTTYNIAPAQQAVVVRERDDDARWQPSAGASSLAGRTIPRSATG